MSIKKQMSTLYADRNGERILMEDGLILATDRAEAMTVPTDRLVQGCMLFVIRTGRLYVLDADGGAWYNVSTGAAITEDV